MFNVTGTPWRKGWGPSQDHIFIPFFFNFCMYAFGALLGDLMSRNSWKSIWGTLSHRPSGWRLSMQSPPSPALPSSIPPGHGPYRAPYHCCQEIYLRPIGCAPSHNFQKPLLLRLPQLGCRSIFSPPLDQGQPERAFPISDSSGT